MNTCENISCGISFIPKPNTTGRFCSPQCSVDGLAEQRLRLSQERRDRRVKLYYENPKKCSGCDIVLPIEKSKNTFCSRSCSASTTNVGKKKSQNTRDKISSSLQSQHPDIIKYSVVSFVRCKRCGILFAKRYLSRPYCSVSCISINDKPTETKTFVGEYSKIRFSECIMCGVVFYRRGKNYIKTCSKKCYSLRLSSVALGRLSDPEYRKKYGRAKKSYMEKTFGEWLNENGVPFEEEVKFSNKEIGKTYFVDFLFRDLKLIIELDGNHHDQPDRKALDKIRDDFLQSLGYTVLRITHREYRNKSRIKEIKNLLRIVS